MVKIPKNIKDIILDVDNPEPTNNIPVVKILFEFPCEWTILDVSDLLKIIELWIEGEEKVYPLPKYKGRWMLFSEICKVFGYPYEEVKKVVDVKKELDRMDSFESDGFLRLEEGRHSVVFVGEPVESTYTDKDGKTNDQIVFDVQYKQEAKRWSIPKGIGTGSIQYQLFKAAAGNNYLFNGLMVSFMVTGKDKQKRYTVIEYKPNNSSEVIPLG